MSTRGRSSAYAEMTFAIPTRSISCHTIVSAPASISVDSGNRSNAENGGYFRSQTFALTCSSSRAKNAESAASIFC